VTSLSKVVVVLCLGALFSSAFFGVWSLSMSSAQSTQTTGVIIPLYTYPTDGSWSGTIQTKQSYPSVPIIAIINPNNGPGSSSDPTFVSGIKSLQNAGVIVLGYVATGYATSSYSGVSNMESQMADYKNWYGVNGIFFDEMSSSGSTASYYQTLETYAKSLGFTMNVGNPGTTVSTSLVGILNVLCIYENPGMPTASDLNGYTPYGNAGFSYIAYGVSSLPSSSTIQSLDQYTSWIYVTNLGGSNPYNGLPSYFTSEVATLASLNSQAPPTSSSTSTSTISSTSHSTTSATTTTTKVTTSSSSTTSSSVTTKTTSSTVSSSSTVSTTTKTTTTSTTSTSSRTSSQSDALLSVSTINERGNTITGYYVALSQNGKQIASAYSPASFTLVSGETYVVTPENYGHYVFSYWLDTGSTTASRTVSITQNTHLVAVYKYVGGWSRERYFSLNGWISWASATTWYSWP